VREERFELEVGEGVLVGHRAPAGRPALLLHGGPGFSDYTYGLAEELEGIFATIRYTQRGTPPSKVGPPYSVETHVDDALAVLDYFELERGWVVGHSWGAHLALHLGVAHPERLLGIVCVSALGARGDIFDEFGRNLRRGLTPEQIQFVDEYEVRRSEGAATLEAAFERFRLFWPNYFADPADAAPMPAVKIGVECSAETNASLERHFEAGTLERRLPDVRLPALVIHGNLDPLPLRTAIDTAALIPDAVTEIIEGCGHWPWLEQPGEVRRIVERFLERVDDDLR
jgi:pimeloyl-ACP methyl ester carboxylesterase